MKQQNRKAQGIWIALEMERRGMSLYGRAQKIVEDPSLLQILCELEQEEKKHYKLFWEMTEPYDFNSITCEEGELLLAQASTFFFPGGLMQAAMQGALDSPLSLLGEAIEAERSSIAFYTQLQALSEETTRSILQVIINEEQDHLKTLLERVEMLK